MDINKMSDQEIIDFIKSRGSSGRTVGIARSKTIEAFFKEHEIHIKCPKCQSERYVRNGNNASGTSRYKCNVCGKSFLAATNTPFEGTKYTVYEMIQIVKSVLKKETIYNTGKNAKSFAKISDCAVWLMMHKIRHILAEMPTPQLTDIVQMDEKYIRECQKGSRSLVSYLDPTQTRYARGHKEASQCGIFGPEFINVLCAVDNHGHYFAECVSLGPMGIKELDKLRCFADVKYLCTDKLKLYSDWCAKRGYIHYVKPSKYEKTRKARGYVEISSKRNVLSEKELRKNDAIDQQLFQEKIHPHIENAERHIPFHEVVKMQTDLHLTLDTVDSFHREIEDIIRGSNGISAEYISDYVKAFAWAKNYKSSHDIKAFGDEDAAAVLAEIIKYTLKCEHSPTLEEINAQNVANYPRPSTKNINMAKERMKAARQVIIEPVGLRGESPAYEGDRTELIFNKKKFFESIGTTRLNELARENHVYNRKEYKAERIRRMCALENADDIIFHEIMIMRGGIEAIIYEFNKKPEKRKRGRPRKNATP